MSTHSIDDLLTKVHSENTNSQPVVQAIPEVSSIPDQPVLQAKEEVPQDVSQDAAPPEEEVQAEAAPEIAAEKPASPIDEYGNPIEKPKMYSEEEVQRMIRDRLARGRHQEQPTQQQVQQEVKNFQADPNSGESWETQLEAFVEKTIEKRQAKLSERQWQQQESARQAEFESKFTSGMSKYQDFHDVVTGKTITNNMMIAARGLENPAAFIYGAAKLHPQELERIARIDDKSAQALEVGRLHERMVKARVQASKAPKPIEAPKGDMAVARNERPSIDALIKVHEKQKFGAKR